MLRPLIALAALTLYGSSAWSADYVAMSGKDLYQRFCAACHGAEGRGDGPVAASFKVEVPDLTLIARRAGNTYPRERVVRIIDGRFIIGAHGSRTMPVWGEDFSRIEIGTPDAERATRIVIDRLADYLGELQKPATR
ncbi:MAG TPA: cytochrome c [Steroidobacteraceae bacterium]|jgi:mono/diheme cytochrome c family protein|nr:cytochrome c [Steroidobacteraceae bacterium]